MTESSKHYRDTLADTIIARRTEIADDWLRQLVDVVNEEKRDIFPTATYLDHIPVMIEELAHILRSGVDASAEQSAIISRKATELGELRHEQDATVHQLLREYDLLTGILEDIVLQTTLEFGDAVSLSECIAVTTTMSRIVRSILQATVDAFVERYTATIGEQTERLRSLNSFIGHELRTPLQSASLTVEMMLETSIPDSELSGDLQTIQASIEQISSLLISVEALVQPDVSARAYPSRQRVDIAAMMRDIGEQQSAALHARDVTLDVQSGLGSIVVETAQLSMVLSNLLGNAVKYSDPAKATRTVAVKPAPCATDDKVAITMRDNGLGISLDRQSKVFGLRERAHEDLDSTHDVSGHGIGLYLVAEAVKEMRGEIRLASVEGEWTEFTLELPRHAPAPGS